MSLDFCILVSGANGFVGKPLCNSLFQQGHAVRYAVRIENAKVEHSNTVTIGDISGQTDWRNVLKSRSYKFTKAKSSRKIKRVTLKRIVHR